MLSDIDAEFEGNVDAGFVERFENDVLAQEFLESRLFDRQAVLPGSRLVTRYAPAAVLFTTVLALVSTLTTVTVAAATGAPVGSVMIPEILARTSCAKTHGRERKHTNRRE